MTDARCASCGGPWSAAGRTLARPAGCDDGRVLRVELCIPCLQDEHAPWRLHFERVLSGDDEATPGRWWHLVVVDERWTILDGRRQRRVVFAP